MRAEAYPNRIYEGGCFGVPSLSAARTETGTWVTQHQQGWAFPDPLEKNLAKFLANLTIQQWIEMKQTCLSHPREDFFGEGDYVKLVKRMEDIEII